MANRGEPNSNSLWISWHDSNWIPMLNPANVMDYFSEKSNPFYDRTCNNEIVKMQRQSLEQLNNMVGMEYILLHVQDPILYVIRKQHRHTSSEATPLADYHIIAGIVYQAPDLASVFNSRLLSTVHHLQSAFEEASSYARYHPSKGYSWDFSTNKAIAEKTKAQVKKEAPTKEEPSSLFQRQRVDMLLSELLRKFPPPVPQNPQQVTAAGEKTDGSTEKSDSKPDTKETSKENAANNQLQIKQEPVDPSSPMDISSMNNIEVKQEVITEIMKAPPEKKMKL